MDDALLQNLIQSARFAAARAYEPYSRFRVGAALLGSDGVIYSGCNVENASYGLTICAERAAVFAAIAGGCKNFDALVIYTPTPQPQSPCGACRQVLAEFCPKLQIISVCDGSGQLNLSLEELLPHRFNL